MEELKPVDSEELKPLDSRKEQIRQLPEVINISNSIDLTDPSQISKYGYEPSENLSKINDRILEDIKRVKTETIMCLKTLTKTCHFLSLPSICNFS